MVPHTEEIAPRPAEEPTVLTDSAVSREEVPTTEHLELLEPPKVADRRQAAEPQVEE